MNNLEQRKSRNEESSFSADIHAFLSGKGDERHSFQTNALQEVVSNTVTGASPVAARPGAETIGSLQCYAKARGEHVTSSATFEEWAQLRSSGALSQATALAELADRRATQMSGSGKINE